MILKKNNLIGIDFDNTLINYDDLITNVVRNYGWFEDVTGRDAVKKKLRTSSLGDEGWQKIQGVIYGPRILDAKISVGADHFLRRCKAEGIEVKIISHKTEFAVNDPTNTNLRDAALNWMSKNNFFTDLGINKINIFFANTIEEKIQFIRKANISIFIDDLEEILDHPKFPIDVEAILYQPNISSMKNETKKYRKYQSFDQIEKFIFNN